MTVRQHEWIQRTWERAGQDTYDQPGDFYDLIGLYPNPVRTKLLRALSLTDNHVQWPATFEAPEGAFYDQSLAYYVFLGNLTTNDHLASTYYEQDWTEHGPNDLTVDVSAYGALCGYSRRNLRHWGGKYYLLTDNFDLYAGSSYESAPTKLWDATGGLSARILFAYGDRMFFIDNQGTVYRLNATADGFDEFHTPVVPLDIRYATAFHQYLVLVSRADDGAVALHRLPDVNPLLIHQVAALQGATGREIYGSPYTDGSLYVTHRDRIYFTSGWYAPDTETTVDLYSFNGAQIERIAQVRDLPAYDDTQAAGLDVWRDELILWYVRTDVNNQQIRMLVGDGFTTLVEVSAAASSYSCLYPMAGELLLVAQDKSSNEGFYHSSGLQDGYLITSWLDFGAPGRVKRLDRITVHVDTASADLDILLKYRLDDATTWTTAATCTDTRIATVDPKDVQFYRAQFRIELDDDSGQDLDAGIDLLSVIYSVNS